MGIISDSGYMAISGYIWYYIYLYLVNVCKCQIALQTKSCNCASMLFNVDFSGIMSFICMVICSCGTFSLSSTQKLQPSSNNPGNEKSRYATRKIINLPWLFFSRQVCWLSDSKSSPNRLEKYIWWWPYWGSCTKKNRSRKFWTKTDGDSRLHISFAGSHMASLEHSPHLDEGRLTSATSAKGGSIWLEGVQRQAHHKYQLHFSWDWLRTQKKYDKITKDDPDLSWDKEATRSPGRDSNTTVDIIWQSNTQKLETSPTKGPTAEGLCLLSSASIAELATSSLNRNFRNGTSNVKCSGLNGSKILIWSQTQAWNHS